MQLAPALACPVVDVGHVGPARRPGDVGLPEDLAPALAGAFAAAFGIHPAATSPQSGFLRVVPGSYTGGTDGTPPGLEGVDDFVKNARR